MDNLQGAKLTRFERLVQFHTDHLTEINAAVPGFADEITVLSGQIDEINHFDQLASVDISGHTTDKANARNLLKDLLLSVATAIRIYATRPATLDEVLAGKATFTKSQIDGFETDNLPNEAQVIHDLAAPLVAATPNPLAKWSATPAKVTALQDAITDFRNKKDAPRNAELEIVRHHQDLADKIEEADETAKTLKLMLVLLPANLQQGFKNIYALDDPQTSHTGATGIITDEDTGQPLANIEVKSSVTDKDGNPYTATTDAEGKYTLDTFKNGSQTFFVNVDLLQGYGKAQETITLTRGKRKTLNFKLKAQA